MHKKQKILIASVLKPVDDVRHYRKIARSLASANKYEIFIIGKGSRKNSEQSDIHFIPTGNFQRLSLRRLLVQIILMKTAFKVRPDLLLVTAPELLISASILKKLIGLKLVYDVQENYHQNITYQYEYPYLQKILFKIALWVSGMGEGSVDHFLFAECIYGSELAKPEGTFTILENKTLPEDTGVRLLKNFSRSSPMNVLISGTLSPYTNTVLGIRFFKTLQSLYPNATLRVIGKIFNQAYKEKLMTVCEGTSQIVLELDDHEVPYEVILSGIHHADVGIVPYMPNKVNKDKVPTKVFEYAANNLPYFIQKGTHWEEAGTRLGGAIAIDFENPDPDFIQKALLDTQKLFKSGNTTESTWVKESADLNNAINTLLSEN